MANRAGTWQDGSAMRIRATGVVLLLLVASAAGGADEGGALLYGRHCAACHGLRGGGDGPDAWLYEPRPPALASRVAHHPPEELVRMLREQRPLTLDAAARRARSDELEAIVGHLRRLPAVDWRRVERGEEVWVLRCESCHGRYGAPPPTLPPGVERPRDLGDPGWQRATDDEQMARAARHGRGGMPAIPGLAADQARDVVAYVRLLSPGYRLYSAFCSNCHGDDGRTDQSAHGEFAPTVVFDRTYLARHDAEQLRVKSWHMLGPRRPRMPHFGHVLSEAEARAVVAYLPTLR